MNRFIAGLFFSMTLSISLAQKAPIIQLRKTPCLGTCPEYSMKIFANRKVKLEAGQFVKPGNGIFKGRIGRKKFRLLTDKFIEIGFFEFDDTYSSHLSDSPSVYIFFQKGERSKQIDDHGSAPAELKSLEMELEGLIDEVRWRRIKTVK